MKKVKFTKHQYDMVYEVQANIPAKGEDQLEVGVRLLRKLKARGIEVPLGDQQRKMKEQGKLVFASYEARGDVELSLQNDEYSLLQQKLKAFIPSVTGHASEFYFDLLQDVKNAEDIED